MQATRSAAPAERVTVDEAGTALCAHLASLGRKRSTLASYDSHIRIDLAPFFGLKPLDKIEPGSVERLIHAIAAAGKSPKTASNALGVLHRIFEYGIRRGWVQSNPVKLVERPRRHRRPGHSVPRPRRDRGPARSGPRRRPRSGRARDVPHRRDRYATGRAPRSAGRTLVGRPSAFVCGGASCTASSRIRSQAFIAERFAGNASRSRTG